jgi:O-methyltransferase domain/Dimerisation domain
VNDKPDHQHFHPRPVRAAESRMSRADSAMALRRMIFGFRLTQCIAVAARLGLADRLHDGPRSAETLAEAAGVEAVALRRLMRALASEGVFAETADGNFETTALGDMLRSDAPSSLREVAMLYGEPWLWQAYGDLLHSVRTGRPAFEHVHGQSFYGFLQEQPGPSAVFQRAMSGFTAHEVAAISSACDLSTARTVVDVGGGHGALMTAVLGRHPALHGIVLDLPEVIGGARYALGETGLSERCQCVGGDFFEAVPSGGDVYLMKSVLHNWGDDDAMRILRVCRRAMQEEARLIVAERVVPKGNGACEAKLFDINMMVTVGGQERTLDEYRELMNAAGLRLIRSADTASSLSVIEAVPDDRPARAVANGWY